MQNKITTITLATDEELMFHISKGEALAFDELYFRYSKRLLGYFIRMLNFDREVAQDALQDLFLKIAEHPEKFDRSRSFKTWVFSTASNTCKNYYRHQQVVKEAGEEITYHEQNEIDLNHYQARFDAKQFRKMLEEILNELPVEKKEVFILKYQEEKSIKEIAEIQNCPEGSVKSRLHHTLKVLEEKLKMFNPVN